MTVKYLERMTWPEVRAQIEKGCTTIVVCFGSHEQHGRHLPFCTDAVLGDTIGERLAQRFNAFLAPVFRVGCSEHHMAFPGTITLTTETFGKIVTETTRSLARHGFTRILLIPTHGGNFKPLEDAFRQLEPIDGCQVLAYTDLNGFAERMNRSSAENGVSIEDAGSHAGEWETSFMLSVKPDLVKMEQAVTGYVGEPGMVREKVFNGLHHLDDNGVIGDPTRASSERGGKYIDDVVDVIFDTLNNPG